MAMHSSMGLWRALLARPLPPDQEDKARAEVGHSSIATHCKNSRFLCYAMLTAKRVTLLPLIGAVSASAKAQHSPCGLNSCM